MASEILKRLLYFLGFQYLNSLHQFAFIILHLIPLMTAIFFGYSHTELFLLVVIEMVVISFIYSLIHTVKEGGIISPFFNLFFFIPFNFITLLFACIIAHSIFNKNNEEENLLQIIKEVFPTEGLIVIIILHCIPLKANFQNYDPPHIMQYLIKTFINTIVLFLIVFFAATACSIFNIFDNKLWVIIVVTLARMIMDKRYLDLIYNTQKARVNTP